MELTNTTPPRMVVCAANLIGDTIICGARHYDSVMHSQLKLMQTGGYDESTVIQGFIDQRGAFLTREQAWIVATAAGQIIRRVGGDGQKLYSENLY